MDNKHLAISIIVGVSLLGGSIFAFSELTNFGSGEQANMMSEAGAFSGHVTLVVYDQFGNIKHYQQTDNDIINEGEDCIAEYMFGAASGCAPGAFGDFDVISLGTGTPIGTTLRGTITALVTANTLIDGVATLTQASTNANEDNILSKSITTIVATFAPVTTTVTYKEVGLINAAGDFMAYQNLGDATINGGADSLTVTWTITVG